MSWTGQCPACGEARLRENIVGISTHSGPAFNRWRRGCLAAFGINLLDDNHETR